MFTLEEKRHEGLRYLLAVQDRCAAADRKHPTLLYLHGAGSRGTDLKVLLESAFFKYAFRLDVPLRIYAPQCDGDSWFDRYEQLLEFAGFAYAEEGTDPDRFYVSGVSMGGYAAWQLGMSRPELFAALVPVCGGGMYWNAERLKEIPIWAFHGEEDRSVFVCESVHMVEAVRACGGHARLSTYPGIGHNAWDPAYSDPATWDWILEQRRPARDPEA